MKLNGTVDTELALKMKVIPVIVNESKYYKKMLLVVHFKHMDGSLIQ